MLMACSWNPGVTRRAADSLRRYACLPEGHAGTGGHFQPESVANFTRNTQAYAAHDKAVARQIVREVSRGRVLDACVRNGELVALVRPGGLQYPVQPRALASLNETLLSWNLWTDGEAFAETAFEFILTPDLDPEIVGIRNPSELVHGPSPFAEDLIPRAIAATVGGRAAERLMELGAGRPLPARLHLAKVRALFKECAPQAPSLIRAALVGEDPFVQMLGCAAAGVRELWSETAPAPREALLALLAAGPAELRVVVLDTFQKLRLPGVADAVTRSMSDPDPEVRWKANEAFAFLPDLDEGSLGGGLR